MSKASIPFEHLVVIHYHWRPGGVRRVVELTLPAIAAAAGTSLKRITLLSGGNESERPELGTLGLPTNFIQEPACDYFSNQAETPEVISGKIQRSLWRVMEGSAASRTLIWFQNPALARNAILCREVAKISKETGAALILHHHDFWCAGRWARWSELQQCGCPDLSSAADILFASGTRSVHAGINLQDFQTLKRCFPANAFHLPNPFCDPPHQARRISTQPKHGWRRNSKVKPRSGFTQPVFSGVKTSSRPSCSHAGSGQKRF
jgi:hypothetical protein